MTLTADTRVLRQLVRGLSGPGTHGERLQRFYAPQAEHYDEFRECLLGKSTSRKDARACHTYRG